jgi:DNA-binding response OmpR family regulator
MAITAYGNGVAKEALEAGADRAATKPVQFNAPAVEIRELLFRSQLQGRPEPAGTC